MNIVLENHSPLPFYGSIEEQNHNKDYAFGSVYSLITHANMLMPFQVILDYNLFPDVDEVYLHNVETGEKIFILNEMNEAGLTYKNYTNNRTGSSFTIVKYPAILPITPIKQEGQYYLEIIGGAGYSIYSDIFCVNNNVDNCLLLRYNNSYDLATAKGMIDFSDNFEFRVLLNTQIGKPEYKFEEEATERMGYSFMESQVSKKIFKFTCIAPEYLCDALRIVRLCSSKTVQSKGRAYSLSSFSIDVTWETQGDLASIECEFETDTVIANIGGYKAKELGGDYSEMHYSNDYSITQSE